MKQFVIDIYKKYKNDFDMFNYHPENLDDELQNYYVYAWFTTGINKKYFYVGKGKGQRYKHIILEIETYEKNQKKYKGKRYKILRDNFGIDFEFIYKNLTEKEASILEAHTMVEFIKNKEPLLNVILPSVIMNDLELCKYRDSYFYEKNKDIFLSYFR